MHKTSAEKIWNSIKGYERSPEQCNHRPIHGGDDIIFSKVLFSPKLIHNLKAIPIKITAGFLKEFYYLTLKDI